MAAAGFYYYLCNERVLCAFNGIELGGWKEGNDPIIVYLRWVQFCRYISNETYQTKLYRYK